MAKLLTIDGLNIVRRVYEANRDPDTPEKAEAALRHALSSFRTILSTHEPSHALAAFDHGGHTWRHDLYPRYRENRKPMPDVLKERLPGFIESLSGLGLTAVSVPDVEADDVIATVVMRWLKERRGDAIVATTDKDLHVLIQHGAVVWNHFNNELRDRNWVQSKFGIPVEMLSDYLALVGDATDGIPGVSKVGAKTAAELMNTYKTLDGVMAGAGILMTPLGKRLRQDANMLQLSRKLVELKTDVRVGVTWNALQYSF
jgi:DNA polymerase-1